MGALFLDKPTFQEARSSKPTSEAIPSAHDSVPLEPTTVGVTLKRIGTKALEYLYPWQTQEVTRLNFVVLGLKRVNCRDMLLHIMYHKYHFSGHLECFQVLLGCYKILQNCEVIPSQLTVAGHQHAMAQLGSLPSTLLPPIPPTMPFTTNRTGCTSGSAG